MRKLKEREEQREFSIFPLLMEEEEEMENRREKKEKERERERERERAKMIISPSKRKQGDSEL